MIETAALKKTGMEATTTKKTKQRYQSLSSGASPMAESTGPMVALCGIGPVTEPSSSEERRLLKLLRLELSRCCNKRSSRLSSVIRSPARAGSPRLKILPRVSKVLGLGPKVGVPKGVVWAERGVLISVTLSSKEEAALMLVNDHVRSRGMTL